MLSFDPGADCVKSLSDYLVVRDARRLRLVVGLQPPDNPKMLTSPRPRRARIPRSPESGREGAERYGASKKYQDMMTSK